MSRISTLTKLIVSLAIILSCLMVSKALVALFELTIPASVLGLLLLFFLLNRGWIKKEQVTPSGNILLKYFPLFFIPSGVGIVEHIVLVQANLYLILTAVLAATLSTLLVVSQLASKLKVGQRD